MKGFIRNFWKNNKVELGAWAGVILIYVVLMVLGVTCPIKYISGISCAGCGITRACLSALTLNFEAAFSYHPMWPTLPVVAALMIFFKLTKRQKCFDATIYVFGVLMIGVYIYRMFFVNGDIVVFSPKSGLIYRAIEMILGFIKG